MVKGMNDAAYYETILIPDNRFPVRLIWETMPAGNIFYRHWHEHLELWYLKKGRTEIASGSKTAFLNAGDLAVFHPNELHSGFGLHSEQEFCCIIISPAFFESGYAESRTLFESFIHQDHTVSTLFRDIFKEYQYQNAGFDYAVKGKIYELIVYLIRNYAAETLTGRQLFAHEKSLERMRIVLQYIEENLAKQINTATLAKLLHMSQYHFCRLFREATGRSVVQYVNEMRIDKACRILKETNLNITEAGLTVGFSDSNYFSRTFKKYCGITPSGYRKACEQE